MSPLSHIASTLRRSESGAALIEAVVAAVVLILVAVGTLAGIDGGQKITALNRSRSVAADLAERDQELMRTMTAAQLSDYSNTSSKAVGGITYTIASKATWVHDDGATVSCTSDSTSAAYLAITSTVTWPNMGPVQPVVQRSIYAPPAGAFGPSVGTAAISVTDRSGNPISGAAPSLTGADPRAGVTGADGCAVFPNMTAGNYNLTLSDPGYVDPSGSLPNNASVSVPADTTTLLSYTIDQAAQVNVSFDTRVGSSWVPAQSDSVTVTGTGLPSGSRTFVTSNGQPASTVGATSLFPLTGGYAVYAGRCSSADPRQAPTSSTNYFSTYPGQVSTDPGSTTPVTIHLPAINLVVKRSGVVLKNAHVTINATGSGCTSNYPDQYTNSSGQLPSPGFPFGSYSICADDGYRRVTTTVQNTNVLGTTTQTLNIPTSGWGGSTC